MKPEEIFTILIVITIGTIVGIFSLMIGTVEPLESAITYNYFSQEIGLNTYDSGLHLIGPFKRFIKYPKTNILVEFSSRSNATVIV